MKHDSRLIQRPQSQPRLHRVGWSFVTGLFWVVYAYLWIPVVTLVLWLLGVRLAVFEMYLKEHQADPFLLTALPLMAVVTAVLLIGWAEFNRMRFGDQDRRSALPPISQAEVAEALGASPQVAQSLSAAKVVQLEMTEHATPQLVRMLTPLAAVGQDEAAPTLRSAVVAAPEATDTLPARPVAEVLP